MTSNETAQLKKCGPVLFAYDGSELAGFAISQAGLEIETDREALVLCVWQPADVGFKPIGGRHFDAGQAMEVKKAAEETAQFGASLAEQQGFRAQSLAVEAAPTWKGIVEVAAEHTVSLIVLGSHRHAGLLGHLHGALAAAVVTHSTSSVFIVHPQQQG